MALAESMKNLVNDLKASRRSRHEFVKGNREITKNMMAENRKFIQDIHAQNQARAEQTRAFLKSSKETCMQDFKQTMDRIKGDISRIHQTKEAITQGAREMIKEFREDAQMAHKYWASLATDKPIGETAEDKKKERKTRKRKTRKVKEKQGDIKLQEDAKLQKALKGLKAVEKRAAKEVAEDKTEIEEKKETGLAEE